MSEASGSTFLEFLLCGVERWDSENVKKRRKSREQLKLNQRMKDRKIHSIS